MRITKVIASRVLAAIPTLILATLVVFILQHLVPGDPAIAIAGDYATQDRLEQIRDQLDLNSPWYTQYMHWVGGAFTGDLGSSFQTNQPVIDLILQRLPLTLLLTALALLSAILVGLPSGVLAAKHAETRLDRILTTGATFGLAIPNFWLGMMLILMFPLGIGWFPGPGGVDINDQPLQAIWGLVLPAIALGLVGAAEICRQVRSAMIENLSSDYIRTLHAKGVPFRRIVWKHALKNSSLPFATIIGLQVSRLIGAAVVVETVFGLSGIGSLVVEATQQRDYQVIQGVVFVTAIIVLVTNMIVDISYRVLDPRIT